MKIATKLQLLVFATTLALTSGLLATHSAQAAPTYEEAGGYNQTCYAPNERSGKLVPVLGRKDMAMGYYGFSTHNNAGWPMIIFDPALDKYPTIIARFTYYHECAHLAMPTGDEVAANCMALKQMRGNGDLPPEEETVVANFIRSFDKLGDEYMGSGKAFWAATLQCADGANEVSVIPNAMTNSTTEQIPHLVRNDKAP